MPRGFNMTFPGESLLIKLWETLGEKGIGKLLTPWQIKREGRAQLEVRRTELVALAAAERDAEDIRAGRTHLIDIASRYPMIRPKHLEIEQPNSSMPRLEELAPLEAAIRTSIGDAIRREVNVAKAIVLAEQQLQDDPQQPSERTIEEDWLFRWRDYAGDVSFEKLQILWGKLLAGELKSPGTYSLRALDFVRNLSSDEAQDIALLSRFVLKEILARSQKTFLDQEGINFGFLMRMQELGVVSGVESVGLETNFTSSETERFVHVLCSHGRVLVVSHEDPAKTLKLDVYKITEIGKQILRLGTFAPHEGYLRKLGEEIKRKGFSVVLGNYRRISETRIQVFDEERL
jgi:hypothetical protein